MSDNQKKTIEEFIFESEAEDLKKNSPKDKSKDKGGKIKSAEKVKRANTHKAAFPVGLIVVILALAGVCSLIYFAVTGITAATKKNKSFDEYNKLLTPVVLIDPGNFDDITKADMNELLEMSLWSLLKSDIAPDKYTGDGNGLSIPKEDVEAQFIKLFGTEISPTHGNIEGYGYEFTYDSQTGKYYVPLTGIVPIYTPKVVEKKTSSDTIVLTVACIAGEGWEQGENGEMVAPAPDKYIKVTLREKDGASFISAIQNTASPETATAESTTESTTANKDLLQQAEQVASENPSESQASEAAPSSETVTETEKP